MPGINYDKWASLNSDSDSDDDGNNAAPKANKSSAEARPSKTHVSAPDATTSVAQRRKAEADVVFNTVLGRRLDPTTRDGFTEAIRLYEGALAALPNSATDSAAAARDADLKLSCHMNIAAASIQLAAWAQANKHCERALALAPALPKALEFQAHVLWQGLGRPAAAAEALRKGFSAAEAAGMSDPAKEMPELAHTWRKAMEAVARQNKPNSSGTASDAKATTTGDTVDATPANNDDNAADYDKTAANDTADASSTPQAAAATAPAAANTTLVPAGPASPPAPLPLPPVESPAAALPAETLAAEAATAEAAAQRRLALQSAAHQASKDAASRKAVTTALAEASECKARGDWASAERHLKDAKRMATAAGDAAGRAAVAGLLAQALAAQAVPPPPPPPPPSSAAALAPPGALTMPGIQVSPTGVHRVVADERRLKAALEELREGLGAADQALREISGMPRDTTAAAWTPSPPYASSDGKISPAPTSETPSSSSLPPWQSTEVALRVWLTRARLQRQAAELKGLQVKGPLRERGFAHDRNAARVDAVACLRDALRSVNIAIGNSNGSSGSSNDNSSSNSDNSTAPPGSATVRVGVLVDLGRALLQTAEPEVDSDDERSSHVHGNGEGSCEEEEEGGENAGDERNPAAVAAAKEAQKKRILAGRSSRAEAVTFLLQARDALAFGEEGGAVLNQEGSAKGTSALRADLEELLADAYAGLGDATSAMMHAQSALSALSDFLAVARGIKPNGTTLPPRVHQPLSPSQESPSASTLSSQPNKRALEHLARDRYGHSVAGKAELRVAAAELNLASLTMLSLRQSTPRFQPGHTSTALVANAVNAWKTAAQRLRACGEPLRGAQALQQAAHEAFLNDQDREMAGGLMQRDRRTEDTSWTGAAGGTTDGSSTKESEVDRQQRHLSAAECLTLAAEYYKEAKDLFSMTSGSTNGQQQRRRQPLSAEPISAKPSRRAAYLISKEVECLHWCTFLWQFAPHELAATHQRLHQALSIIALQSQSPVHRKHVADNQHRWAVAVACAARDDRASSVRPAASTSSSSNSRGAGVGGVDFIEGVVEGLQGADTLLEAAGTAYTDLKLPRDAAGCLLARGVLAHRSGRLPDAVAHLTRAQTLFVEHDKAAGAGAGAATSSTAAAPADDTAAKSCDNDADRVECSRLLTAWTKELETTATTAATAATADKSSSEAKDKEADVPSGDVQGGSQMPPAAVTVAQNNGLKRRCVGTASSGGGDGATTTTTPETMNRSEEEAMADRSSFWELVGLIDARYGRRTFALLVCAMTAFFAFVFSVIV